MEKKKYFIEFGGRKFQIISTDAEEHIEQVQQLLKQTYDALEEKSKGELFSHITLKVILKFADDLIKAQTKINNLLQYVEYEMVEDNLD